MAHTPSRTRILAVAATAALIAGLLGATTAAGAADRPRGAVAAPAGIWAGHGDGPGEDDWTIVVVSAGGPGAQTGFLLEYAAGACGPGEVILVGPATYLPAGDFISFTGNFVCADSGDTIVTDVELRFKYDEGEDTLTAYSFDGENWVVYEGYPAPFTRRCAGSNNTQKGTSGDDVIDGTSGHDVIDGKGGNDTINGKGGMDILCGQKGKDRLEGGGSVDVLVGSSGRDKAFGGASVDVLLGGSGPDTLKGEAGDDWMFGGSKADTLVGGTGYDTADGEGGADTCKAEFKVSC